MSRHTLKLIALAAIFSVAPALGGNASATGSSRHCCPKKHAQAAAAAASGHAQQASAATTITLSDRIPEGSLLNLGGHHTFFTP